MRQPFRRTAHVAWAAPALGVWILLATLTLVAPAADAFKLKWKPVDKDLLAETAGKIDPEAGAEAIFWEIYVTDTYEARTARSEVKQYLRIKIYNDRGRDSEAHVDIPYINGESVEDIAGRTIRPDGSTVELKKEAIFDRTIIKMSGFKGKAKSFALPAVAQGCVLEYQWSTVRHDVVADNLSFPGQRNIPVRELTYHLKPLVLLDWGYAMRIRSYNGTFPPPVDGPGGERVITLSRIDAIRDEPYMPATDQIRPLLVLDYSDGKELPVDAFWAAYGKERYKDYHRLMSVSPLVKALSDSLTNTTADFNLRVKALYDYCRTRIRDIYDDAQGFTDDFREKNLRDKDRTPEKTLKRGLGTNQDIEMLFAALATAAGFETRVALVGDRSESFFNRDRKSGGDLSEYMIAIRVMGAWRFYDPALIYVPFGMLPWWEENQDALVLDAEEPVFVSTPLSPPASSCRRRTARLRLDEDGSVQGDVSVEYTGHLAAKRKEELDELSPDKREENTRDEIHRMWSAARISDIHLIGATDPLVPLTLSYHVTIPNYAEHTGQHLLLQPSVFQQGVPPVFPASTRRNWLYFPYPWSEEDSVVVELPAGYQLEESSAPAPLLVGRTLGHHIEIDSADQKTLRFRRTLMFGADGAILLPVAEYAKMKSAFDSIHERDGYTVTLTRIAKGAAGE